MALLTQTDSPPARTAVRRCCYAVLMAASISAVLLTGCGNKGPLYLPEAAPITEIGPGEPPVEEASGDASEQPDSPTPLEDGAVLPTDNLPQPEGSLQ